MGLGAGDEMVPMFCFFFILDIWAMMEMWGDLGWVNMARAKETMEATWFCYWSPPDF